MFHIGFTQDDLKRVIWTFLFAFGAAFYAIASGWSALPNFNEAKAAAVAAGLAGLAAAGSFLKNLVFADGSALK